MLEGIEAAGVLCRTFVVPDHGSSPPIADDDTVAVATNELRASGCDVVVSVGAGTINDIAKASSTIVGLPYVTVPSAASMNGYTSAIAAILSSGVKRTRSTQQTEAVFADIDVLRQAPLKMNLAGFGDLSSKPYSNACWYLSSRFAGAGWSSAPAELLDGPFLRLLDAAHGIGTGDPNAIRLLIETLLLSGCAMALAGSSSPASGGEHLLSHYWDMVEHGAGRDVRALHGTQVGIATVLSARLYDRILHLDPAHIDIDAAMASHPKNIGELRLQVANRHPDLPQSVVSEIVQECEKKYTPAITYRTHLTDLRNTLPELQRSLATRLLDPSLVYNALLAANAPTQASEIGVDPEKLAHTVLYCRDIRARYTVLDLAHELGVLKPFAQDCENAARQGRLP